MTMPKRWYMTKRSCPILMATLAASPVAAHITLETNRTPVGA